MAIKQKKEKTPDSQELFLDVSGLYQHHQAGSCVFQICIQVLSLQTTLFSLNFQKCI